MILGSFFIALFAVTYRKILSQQPPLNWWFHFGNRFKGSLIWQPLWGCEKCLAGQLAFWTYLLCWYAHACVAGGQISRILLKVVYYINVEKYSLFGAAFFIACAVFFTVVISQLYERYIR